MAQPTIYFVRHGETDWNAEARLQGQRDVPLNDFGRVQAEEAGARLRGLMQRYGDLDFVASPLSRTRETMERLRETIGLAPSAYRADDRLVELSFGRWEGLTWKEVRRADPKGAAGRERDKWGYAPPGGESYAMLAQRIAPALEELTGDTVLVAHGGWRGPCSPCGAVCPVRRHPSSTSGRGGSWSSKARGTSGCERLRLGRAEFAAGLDALIPPLPESRLPPEKRGIPWHCR